MKLFVKLMLALLVLAVLAPFTLLKDSEGKPLMSFSDFNLPDLPSLSSTRKLMPANRGNGVDLFYKWYDAKGTVQFTTEPPAEGIDYTIKKFDPNTNLIQAVSLPAEEDVTESPETTAGKEPSLEIGSPYNPDDIKKLLEDAKNVEKTLQQRYNDQDAALN